MISVFAFAAFAVGSAVAQVQRPITVAVLNFSNSSGVGGTLLGSRAAAAIEAQMIETGRYDVVKRELVSKTMEDLNLTFPLGRMGLTQLATRLEADAIATGDVTRVVRDAKTNQVRVTIRMELTDRASGELVNGAIATGESGVRPDFSGAEDVLLDEALNRTAFAAVRTMNERILPEGTVFATSSADGVVEALLNIGSNSGVRSGMELIVLRNREQVGRLRASRVSPTDSTAIVISSTRGVQPEDKVRAVFRLDNIPVEAGGTGATASRISRPRIKLNSIAVGALALFGIYKATQGNVGSGSAGARNGTAVASGPYNGAPGSNEIPFVPAIHITWSSPVGVSIQDIVGFGVYRVVELGNARPVHVTSGGSLREYYDNGFAMDIGEGTGNTDAEFGSGKVFGLSAGVTQRYLIRTAYMERTTDDTGTDEGEVTYADEVMTTAATGLLPPTALSVSGDDFSALVFNFRRVPGGDRYVIQVSDNTDFRNPDRYPRSGDGLFFTPIISTGPVGWWGSEENDVNCVPDQDGDQACYINDPRDPAVALLIPEYSEFYAPTTPVTVNLLTGRLDPPGPGRQLYWRVGVRASRDDRVPEGGGYVWGDMIPLTLDPAASLIRTDVAVPPGMTPSARPMDPTSKGMRPGAGRNVGRPRQK